MSPIANSLTHCGRKPRPHGFTLIELMVVLVILSVVLAVAMPAYRTLTTVSQLRASANEFLAGTYLARSEAIKRNQIVRMCVSTDATTCASVGDWDEGWIVTNAANDVIKVNGASPAALEIFSTASIHTMSFDPTGVGLTLTGPGGTVTGAEKVRICKSDPVGEQEREIDITLTGKPRVTSTYNAACPGA